LHTHGCLQFRDKSGHVSLPQPPAVEPLQQISSQSSIFES
jgi:hypothetical protein